MYVYIHTYMYVIGILCYFFFDFQPNGLFLLGAVLVNVSMYLYAYVPKVLFVFSITYYGLKQNYCTSLTSYQIQYTNDNHFLLFFFLDFNKGL